MKKSAGAGQGEKKVQGKTEREKSARKNEARRKFRKLSKVKIRLFKAKTWSFNSSEKGQRSKADSSKAQK